MVNKEIIMETIRKMYESGIEDSIIEATLHDIGLNENEIAEYIAEVKGTSQQQAQATEAQPELIAEKTAARIREHLAEEREDRELRETTQQASMEEQHRHLETVEEGMGRLHERVEAVGTPTNRELGNKMDVLGTRITALERQLSDLKAIANATKDLMEKVLEVNRKILGKL